MREKGQIFIYNDQEIELIKNTFAENEELLYAFRKVLLQFPVSEIDKSIIKKSFNDNVLAVVAKRILPEMSDEFPIGQAGDFYQTLNGDLNVKSVEEMEATFDAKQLQVEYLTQQMNVMKSIYNGTDAVEETIKLDELKNLRGKTAYERYFHTKARNFLLSYIDSMLALINSTAGQKKETVDEAKTRMKRDSSK